MIDLHCHLLPGIDDGAADIAVSLEMARIAAADGITTIACTPHIQPGVFDNEPVVIRAAVRELQYALDDAGIPLKLVVGSDAHIRHDFVSAIQHERVLTLNDTRFVLFEPPHHIAPLRMDDLLFDVLATGYVPILTHPERLTWINSHYDMFQRLAMSGVWMQITAGSLTGHFGRSAKTWAERMLRDGIVHIIATDAHGTTRRRPLLRDAAMIAERFVGAEEARRLVSTRPLAVLKNAEALEAPRPPAKITSGSRPTEGRSLWKRLLIDEAR